MRGAGLPAHRPTARLVAKYLRRADVSRRAFASAPGLAGRSPHTGPMTAGGGRLTRGMKRGPGRDGPHPGRELWWKDPKRLASHRCGGRLQGRFRERAGVARDARARGGRRSPSGRRRWWAHRSCQGLHAPLPARQECPVGKPAHRAERDTHERRDHGSARDTPDPGPGRCRLSEGPPAKRRDASVFEPDGAVARARTAVGMTVLIAARPTLRRGRPALEPGRYLDAHAPP